jgi:SAM-dependent methyltransferase
MALRRLNYEVFGITQPGRDLNDRWAKEQITVRRGLIDKEPLPFRENYFDLVVFTEVLEHLLYDPKPLAHEFHRVLRPSGGLIVSTPNVLRLENRMKILLGRNTYPRYEQFYFSDLYRRHNREYTMQEVISLFKPLFLVKKARYIMMTEFAVPVSDNGKVFDIHEYAEVWKPQRGRNGSRWNFKVTAKLFLRLPKFLYPPFRSGLLAIFVSSKSTPQTQGTT